ncbi:MAG: hypothetical protein WDO71_24995 [Bacteroidota bacterium]
MIIQKKLALYSLQYAEEKYGKKLVKNEHLQILQSRLKAELNFFNRQLETTGSEEDNSLKDFQRIYLEILEEQRRLLDKMNHRFEFDEDLIRKYLSLVDLENSNFGKS